MHSWPHSAQEHTYLLGFDHVTMSICGLSSFPAPADLLFLSSPGLNWSTLFKKKCKNEEKQKAELSYFTFSLMVV